MASIDIFSSNAFSMSNLTNALNLAPYKPQMLGGLGLFTEKPIRTTVAWIEKKGNRLSLLNTANRGTVKDVRSTKKRTAIPFEVPHVPYFQTVLADDIQNVRAFGSETELEAMGSYVNEQLEGMRDDHEVTHEFHRAGAVKGVIYDGDGTTVIYNLFTAFDLTQVSVNFDGANDSFAPTATSIIRTMADKLGGGTFSGILALCGNTYFDGVVGHTSMQAAYELWRNGEFLRNSYIGPAWYTAAASGFVFQNIMFVNYRGKIGDVSFIADTEAYYIPTGVPQLFQEVIAPGDFMETVNTLGRKLYAKQERIAFDKGVELHTQSNVLAMCTRPDAIIKSTYTPAP